MLHYRIYTQREEYEMGFTLVNELPTPAEILEQFPLADHLAALKKERDEEIKRSLPARVINSW